jgi:hypothetical protein
MDKGAGLEGGIKLEHQGLIGLVMPRFLVRENVDKMILGLTDEAVIGNI